MSKPDDAPAQRETEQPNRRTAMMLGALAAVSISTPAVAQPESPLGASDELIAWRTARATYWGAVEARERFAKEARSNGIRNIEDLFANEEYLSLDETMGAAQEPLDAAVETLMARPVHTFHDLVELAEMVRGESRWNPGEYEDDSDRAPSREVIALFDAIEALARRRVDLGA